MADKRMIRGEKYSIEQVVDSAIATVDAGTLDTEAARGYLMRAGHTNPVDELVSKMQKPVDTGWSEVEQLLMF